MGLFELLHRGIAAAASIHQSHDMQAGGAAQHRRSLARPHVAHGFGKQRRQTVERPPAQAAP